MGSQEDGKVPDTKASPVVRLNKDNFQDEIKEGVVFVKFFAPWCGHCKRLAPTWEKLAQHYDDNLNRALCDGQGVNGFPTLNIYKSGEKVEEYSGKRDLDSLVAFVDKHTAPAAADKDEL